MARLELDKLEAAGLRYTVTEYKNILTLWDTDSVPVSGYIERRIPAEIQILADFVYVDGDKKKTFKRGEYYYPDLVRIGDKYTLALDFIQWDDGTY